MRISTMNLPFCLFSRLYYKKVRIPPSAESGLYRIVINDSAVYCEQITDVRFDRISSECNLGCSVAFNADIHSLFRICHTYTLKIIVGHCFIFNSNTIYA